MANQGGQTKVPISVAIIGSGPAGFYTADALVQSDDNIEIDIIERLPAPFGLIRAGVAPDHEKTRNVSRAYAKTASGSQVHYYGNVEVGTDISIAELTAAYDAVVLAIGAPKDRKLGIPGEDKRGVYGSADFVAWYNGHPDLKDLDPVLDTGTAVVIGNGNVAVDIARIFGRTEDRLAETDLADHAASALASAQVTDIYMAGRRGPTEAKFTNVELREMGNLSLTAPVVDGAQLPDTVTGEWSDRDRRLIEKNLATLREFAERTASGADKDRPKRIHFLFFAAPVEILGGETVEGIRFEKTAVTDGRAIGTGETFEIACGLVLPAIGYRSMPLPGVPFNDARGVVPSDDGRVLDGGTVIPGLYAVGWIKRGPTGVIGTNKPDGKLAARQIAEDTGGSGDSAKPGRVALERSLQARGVRWVTWDDWQRIDAAEVARARNDAPRRKFTTVADMLSVLD